jgi:tripartite-type tricarboxylate transporter receptor subunit TctC
MKAPENSHAVTWPLRRYKLRRMFPGLVVCGTLMLGMAQPALAQEAVPRLIRIVVPFSAGASNDAIARAVAGPLAKRLETSVIVENRPGAAGVIGSDAVAKRRRMVRLCC